MFLNAVSFTEMIELVKYWSSRPHRQVSRCWSWIFLWICTFADAAEVLIVVFAIEKKIVVFVNLWCGAFVRDSIFVTNLISTSKFMLFTFEYLVVKFKISIQNFYKVLLLLSSFQKQNSWFQIYNMFKSAHKNIGSNSTSTSHPTTFIQISISNPTNHLAIKHFNIYANHEPNETTFVFHPPPMIFVT